MRRNVVETIMGGVVLLVAAVFFVFALSSADLRPTEGYVVTAKFNSVEGLKPGSEVRMSGIKVGTILEQSLDPKSYVAVVKMNINRSIKLPTDTSARVMSEGLLGGVYVALDPGAEEAVLTSGNEIKFTQGPVSLVDLLGRFIFSGADQGKEKKDGGS
jgi:phospholipid/cholesterol/gamma-HCH transport system substrate-binding protein